MTKVEDELDRIRELVRAYFEARAAFSAHYRTKPDPFDYENEEHIRWELKSNRLCRESVNAERPYRAACDKFFAADNS